MKITVRATPTPLAPPTNRCFSSLVWLYSNRKRCAAQHQKKRDNGRTIYDGRERGAKFSRSKSLTRWSTWRAGRLTHTYARRPTEFGRSTLPRPEHVHSGRRRPSTDRCRRWQQRRRWPASASRPRPRLWAARRGAAVRQIVLRPRSSARVGDSARRRTAAAVSVIL